MIEVGQNLAVTISVLGVCLMVFGIVWVWTRD